MPVRMMDVIERTKVPKYVTLHFDPSKDCIRVLRRGWNLGEITRKQIDDSNGNIDNLLIEILKDAAA